MLPGETPRGWWECSVSVGRLAAVSEQRKAWATYIVLRLLFFAVPFAALYALGLALGFTMMMSGIIAAVLAALIGVSLSILLLSKPREHASESIYAWRNRDRTADDVAEDAVLDGESEGR